MSDVNPLNEKQALVLKEFRESLSDVLKPQHDDQFLLRFLRARQFDMLKAEAMLRKSLKWRQQLGVDYILNNYKVPEVVSKYIPSGFIGFDNDGSSVRVLPQGGVDFKGLVSSIRKLDLVKSLIYTYEYDIQQMQVNNKKTGLNADTFVFILDYDGFSLKQVASKSVMDVIFELIRVFEANYPERLKTAFAINIPPFFSTVFAGVKPFLAEETRKKFRFYGRDGWKADLLEQIHADVLPVYLGGARRDSKGDPKCSSIIVSGGIIPESYYLRNQAKLNKHPDSVEVSIEYKAVHLIEIHVARENSLLEWEIETEDVDLGIGLLYLSKISNPDDDEELYPAEEVLSTEKVSCHPISENGSFLCENPGFYILQLDNSFGKFHQKTITYYRVNVTPLRTAEDTFPPTTF